MRFLIATCDGCGKEWKTKIAHGESVKIPKSFPQRRNGADICDECALKVTAVGGIRQRCVHCWETPLVTQKGDLHQHDDCPGGGKPGFDIKKVKRLQEELVEWVKRHPQTPVHIAAKKCGVPTAAFQGLKGVQISWSKDAEPDPDQPLVSTQQGAPVLAAGDEVLQIEELMPEQIHDATVKYLLLQAQMYTDMAATHQAQQQVARGGGEPPQIGGNRRR